MNESQTISVHQLAKLVEQQPVELLDVRTLVEFREVRALAARNTPLNSIEPESLLRRRNGSTNDPLYVICWSGSRGAKAQRILMESGFSNVINVEGGMEAWIAAGFPVVRGEKVISLERQVRIAAGFLVLAGAIAAIATGKVYLVGISACVGAGLMFAGITDSCAMGMLIARMPWNQVKDATYSTTKQLRQKR